MRNGEDYANIIMLDEREKIVKETPTVFKDDYLERVYEFDDGAVVSYEWQGAADGRTSPDEKYNHRFTLTGLPSPNLAGLKKGVLKVINYPTG
jgi:hypothetical protein